MPLFQCPRGKNMLISPYKKPYIVPPSEHPRLMLRKSDIPRITENISLPENLQAAKIIDELCNLPITGTGATPEYGTYNLAEVLACEALSFRALLKGDAESAQKAIDSLFLLLDSFKVLKGNMGARWGGHLIFTAAQVYDRCYKYLSSGQKEKIIERSEKIAADYFEMGYPPSKQSPVSGHGTEAQLLRDLLAFSVAVYDERPDIYNFCAGRIIDDYVEPVRRLLSGGAHNQGPSYGSYRWVSLAWAELIFRTMSGCGVFNCLENTAEWFIYMTRPDGSQVRLGDDFNESKGDYNRRAPFTVPFFFGYALTGREDIRRLFRNGLCREYMLPAHSGMDFYSESSWGEGLFSAVSLLIFDRLTEPHVSEKPKKCAYFGSPVGETVFKDEDTHILFKIGEYWGANHDHLDTGCFQIFSGAPLITDSGVYDSYHSSHRRQYLTKTSAHNCLTVEIPDKPLFGEWDDDIAYDGGTRRPANGDEAQSVEELISDEYLMAKILFHEESETGCVLSGDLTPAYSHSCSAVKRTMSYNASLRKVTVRDEVTSLKSEYRKTFHIHCQTEPEINGNTVVFENNGHRAVCRVISPENAVITKVGGDGKRFLAGGVDYPPNPPYEAEEGWGEVKISPRESSESDLFLIEFDI